MDINDDLVRGCLALTALLNPLSVAPLFLSFNKQTDAEALKPIALKSSITVAVVIIISILCGQIILGFFGISIDSFALGGGVIIFLAALGMVNARPARKKMTPGEIEEAGEDDDDISIVPLGFPLLAGPGVISTVIIYTNKISDYTSIGIYILFSILLSFIIYESLKYSAKIFARLGRTGINVITRVMGILLLGIAVQIITNAIKNIFNLVS